MRALNTINNRTMTNRLQELILLKAASLLQLEYSVYENSENVEKVIDVQIESKIESIIDENICQRINSFEFEEMHDMIEELLKENPRFIFYKIFALINLMLVKEYSYNENTNNFRDGKIEDSLRAFDKCLEFERNALFYIVKGHLKNLLILSWSPFSDEAIKYLNKAKDICYESDAYDKIYLVYLEFKRTYSYLHEYQINK